MKVTRKDIDELNINLELVLEVNDYKANFDKKLKEYRSKVQMKGFRQGKTPMSLVKKMYGPGILTEVVNDTLGSELQSYLKENEIEYLGQPMPADDNYITDFNPNKLTDFTFNFDLGLSPKFDTKGYDKKSKYNDYKIIVDDEIIQKELDNVQKQLGERVDISKDIKKEDVIKFEAVEQDGDIKSAVDKEGGVTADVTVMVNRIVSEKLKKQVLKLKLGDHINFDIKDMAEAKDDAYMKKFVLGIEEDVECGNIFNGKVIEVKRIEPAELNEATFEKYFGDGSNIKTLDEAKAKIKENIENYFGQSVLSLSNREMLDKILDKNDFALPTEILKKWLVQINDDVTIDQVSEEMPAFEKDLRWRLIKSKIAAANDIEVKPEELRNAMYVRVEAYFRNNYMFDVEQINKTVDQLMQDQEQLSQVHEEILSAKVFDVMRTKVGLKEVKITPDDLNKKVEAYK